MLLAYRLQIEYMIRELLAACDLLEMAGRIAQEEKLALALGPEGEMGYVWMRTGVDGEARGTVPYTGEAEVVPGGSASGAGGGGRAGGS